ncbi:Mu transposase C-terminal domain-containing protein [Pseudoruegeria sp. SK021]|uniref:Mu transposase C-terminal domain-containing protein n=1 Tax=Pseudoruegeria sp. SK021 TaxID=1933035 RepID=UPI000A21C390|nr:Mu transposase C-terminal domain-containing protein [Pseudoruegeria sp. SK021]OSP54462.1 integrase [Pseudoruegeria sp. SK021]
MTQHFRFHDTDCLEISGVEHRFVSADRSGSVWARLLDDKVHLSFKSEEFMQLIARPDTRLKRGHFSDQAAHRRLRCDIEYLQSVAPKVRAKALWQSACARFFLEAEARGETKRTERTVNELRPELERRVNTAERGAKDTGRAPRAGQETTNRRFPSARQLLEWVRKYEAAGRSPIVFLRKRSLSGGSRRLLAESESILAECTIGYMDRNEPKAAKIIENVQDRFSEVNLGRAEVGLPPLPVPAARTVRRRIGAFDKFEVIAQRKGIEAARQKFGFYESGLPADYPLQRVEMDEWLIDVSTLLGDSGALDGLSPEERARFEVGRRWIYVALDCATRCVLGFRIVATPNSSDAIRTLHMILQDKTSIAEAAGCESIWDQSGGIGALVTDQGSAFAAEIFRMAVADLGSTYEAPPAGVPKLRSRVERIFRTFGLQLAPMLIGRTFSDSRERGDYPSEKWAALTDDELARVFTLFIVDIYHNTPHSGLNGETPANAWKRLSAEMGVTPPPDANHRRVVFGIPLSRKLDRHGIRVFGINFTCPELQDALLRGTQDEIPVRVDPDDLTYISVCLGHRWFSAEAVSHAVRGLPLEEWQSIVRDLRTRFRDQAILSEDVIRKARKKIRAIDSRARQLRRVQPQHLNAEDLQRAENRLFLGLSIGPKGSAATGNLDSQIHPERPHESDLLRGVIPSPGPEISQGSDSPDHSVDSPKPNWTFKRD